jgi:stage II sporulation protein P
MRKRLLTIIGITCLFTGVALISLAVTQAVPGIKSAVTSTILDRVKLGGGFEEELTAGEFFTVLDEKSNKVVDKTSHKVFIGDEFITEKNDRYSVVKVTGNKALAKKIGRASDIVWQPEWDEYLKQANRTVDIPAQGNGGRTQIAIYHTHSGESYVPTDGKASIPAKGGIFKVGSTLADGLRNQGISVVDDKTPHEPHDANAYHRSRRTAMNLMKKRPVALIDVHRDGVPDPDFYREKMDNKTITKVRLVIGRQNPNMATNLQFAKKVKAYIDRTKPGLIKGIFIAKGNYNQDLGPKAMLIEVGTHTNSRQAAENGAAILAEALPPVLGLKAQAAPGPGPGKTAPLPATPGEARSAWTTLAWIIGFVLIGGAAFLLLSTGSIKGMTSKLGELKKTEFANFFGLKRPEKKKEKE